MPYDKNDPRRTIELELLNCMQDVQIEYLINASVESEADYIGEIAYLKQCLRMLANAFSSLIDHAPNDSVRADLAEMIADARRDAGEEDPESRPFVGEDHPRFREWQSEVENDNTLLGLADWLEHNPLEEDDDVS